MKWTTRRVIAALVFTGLLAGCGGAMADSPDEIVNKLVGQQNTIYVRDQPVPLYDYSAQRDIVIQLYNATVPKMANTWSVFYEFGTATDVCASKGYPIPFGVSLTSPEYAKQEGSGDSAALLALPQPEPTGLYTNDLSTAASWVLCLNANGAVEPVYAEGNVRTYAHPVTIGADGKIVHDYSQSTVNLDMSKAGS